MGFGSTFGGHGLCFCGLPTTTLVTRVPTGGRIRTGARVTDAIPYGPYDATMVRTGSFIVTNPDAVVLLRVASSAFREVAAGPGIASILVRVDGQLIGTLSMDVNAALLGQHLDLPPHIFNLTGLSAGTHTVELRPGPGTDVSAGDFSQAFVEQFPA